MRTHGPCEKPPDDYGDGFVLPDHCVKPLQLLHKHPNDEHLAFFADPTPYLIKLDVEGYETFAVRGGRKVIAHAPFLMIEVVGHQLRKKGSSVFELHDEIQSLGKQCAWKSIRDQLYTDDATNENTFDVTTAWEDADMKEWTLFVISVFIIYTATWRFKRKNAETKGYSTIR